MSDTANNTTTEQSRTTLHDWVWDQIRVYREQPCMKWDSRDHGNFYGTYFNANREAMRQSEPTGLCEAMLLMTMLDAAVSNITVKLDDVLYTEDFIPNARKIVDVRKALEDDAGEEINAFQDKVNGVLHRIRPDANPSLSEMAICLRDALYSMEQGLTLRWVACEPGSASEQPLRLGQAVYTFDNAQAFVTHLRTDMPYGAHLVNVDNFTAIALKTPGRTAYLSSMRISEHTGNFQQEGSGECQSKRFDFDQPVHRYPSWKGMTRNNTTPATQDTPAHFWGTLNELPTETLLWLTLVVEMMATRFHTYTPAKTDLIEAVRYALPGAASTTEPGRNLPVRHEPSWIAQTFSIKEGLDALHFTEWEQRFFEPLLTGMDWTDFLPDGVGAVKMDIDTHKALAPDASYATQQQSIEFQCFNTLVAGTQQEVDTVRRTIFLRNLGTWVMRRGNQRMLSLWKEQEPFFKKQAQRNLKKIPALPFATLHDINKASRIDVALLYTQNPKRKTFSPLCHFDGRSSATHLLHVLPANSKEIATMLGMAHSKLPDWLQGWSRDTGTWSCHLRSETPCPENVRFSARWEFGVRPFFSIGVTTTAATLPSN